MIKTTILPLLFSLISLVSCMSIRTVALRSPSSTKCELAITSVNLIDLEQKKIFKNVDVSLAGGKIAAIEPHSGTASCAQTIEGSGKFLMPGLVDMHAHSDAVFLPRPGAYVEITNFVPLTLKRAGTMMLTAGVTAFLDLCSAPQDEILGMRDQQRKGALDFDMPDIFSAGSCITSKWYDRAGDPAQFNKERVIADVTLLEKDDDHKDDYLKYVKGKSKVYGYDIHEKESELAKIDALIAKRPDVLKVFYTPSYDKGTQYPSLHIDTIKAIVKRAHASGIPVLAHALTAEEQLPLLDTEIDGFAHAAWEKLDRRSAEFRRLNKQSFVVVPTVTVLTGLTQLENELNDPLMQKVLSSVKLITRVTDEFTQMRGKTKDAMKQLTDTFAATADIALANVASLREDSHFHILMGDDASNLGAFLGVGMHQELESMVKYAGFSTWDALAAATVAPGKFLKMPYGSRPGDIANLILLNENPIEDIRNTRAIAQVILRGKPL